MSRTISTAHPGVLAIFEQVALVDDSAKCYTGPRLETLYWSEEDWLNEVPVHAVAGQIDTPANHILAVYLDGVQSQDQWTEVDTADGWGFRYVVDPMTLTPVIVDGEYQTERVAGVFGLRWLIVL